MVVRPPRLTKLRTALGWLMWSGAPVEGAGLLLSITRLIVEVAPLCGPGGKGARARVAVRGEIQHPRRGIERCERVRGIQRLRAVLLGQLLAIGAQHQWR